MVRLSNKLLDLFLEDLFLSECLFLTKSSETNFHFLRPFFESFGFPPFALLIFQSVSLHGF